MYLSVGGVGTTKTHVAVQSGAPSITKDGWWSTDTGWREDFNPTTDKFNSVITLLTELTLIS